MKIYIDINHPAHVHYFRNFIKLMEEKGHTFVVSNRDSAIINQLLDYYGISHFVRNARSEKQSFFRSMHYLLKMILFCCKLSRKERPDLYLGFAASQCAITSFLFRKPCILLDDTEHNTTNHRLYRPFSDAILTPFYFKKNLGKHQIFIDAYIEQFYLHSGYFTASDTIMDTLGIQPGTPFALIRYISYSATHDSRVRPLSDADKKEFFDLIRAKMPVFVSLENDADAINIYYEEHRLRISPEKIHDLIAQAGFFLTEGATMASEACMLGVPYVYINPLQNVGNLDMQKSLYPTFAYKTTDTVEVVSILNRLLNKQKNNNEKQELRQSIESTTIDPTRFLVWFVENFPNSKEIMLKDPTYQTGFKS